MVLANPGFCSLILPLGERLLSKVKAPLSVGPASPPRLGREPYSRLSGSTFLESICLNKGLIPLLPQVSLHIYVKESIENMTTCRT